MKKKILLIAMSAVLMLASVTACGQGANNGSAENSRTEGDREVSLLLVSHTFVDSIMPLLPEFEEATGIKVVPEVLAEIPAMEKLMVDLSSGTGTYDLFMTSPMQNWQYVTGGWVLPLDDFIDNPEKTPPEWDFDDFVPGVVNALRWTGEPLRGVGEGQLWGLPINYESYMLAYRPSLLRKYGLSVPETYQELADQISYLNNLGALSDHDGQTIHPLITRFDMFWDLTYLTFGTMLLTYNVDLLDEDGNVAIDSPQSIEATEKFVQMIREGSPEGAGLFTWYEALQGFASGQFIYSFNEADGFASTYQNPQFSKISDDVGYAPTPLGPDGTRTASTWIWALSMNSASRRPDDAWQFLQWVTSAETLNRTHLAGNMNPVRYSAWENPDVAEMVFSWGEYPGQFLEVMREMADVAGIKLPAHPEITRILDIWAGAVQAAYFGVASVEDALTQAADEIRVILR